MTNDRGAAGRPIHVVPHTHWDREWYRPFQSFRMRLVDCVDTVLAMMDDDPRFSFTLDGQLATVDDYLEIRPEGEARIRAAVERGALAIGPWQILMDEFLVSGENMIRNLQMGWRRAEELGSPMPVGYLPDMFGHIAQMPQLLRRAGIESAVVWRGVPARIDRHLFRWEAPDGSAVIAHYLNDGYGNAAYLLSIPDLTAGRLPAFAEAMRPYFGDDELLAMYGTDHMLPDLGLLRYLDRLNDEQTDYHLQTDTLRAYVAQTADEASTPMPTWRGELRSSARANILMGVNSARIDLKAACGRAERALERYAEPLSALWGAPGAAGWPEPYLRLAWRRVVENSAHDSICGCSLDAVVDQVLVRFAEAEQLAGDLAARAAAQLAADVPRGAFAIVSPTPAERIGQVELSLPVPEDWDAVALEDAAGRRLATQELERAERLVFDEAMPGEAIGLLLARRTHGRELFGRYLTGWAIGRDEVILEVDVEEDPAWLDLDRMRREIDLATAAGGTWRLRVVSAARRRLIAEVDAPPLGWTALRAVEGAAHPIAAPVTSSPRGLANGLVDVTVDERGELTLTAADGTRLAGVGRIVEGGDRGDSYNYGPPDPDLVVEAARDVAVGVVLDGPLRSVLEVRRTYDWPIGLDGRGRSAVRRATEVLTRVELRSGEPFARVEVAFDNQSDDHRVRFMVPTATPSPSSFAEGQLAVVERQASATEAGHGEVPLPTYPATAFVDAGGAAVLAGHVLEYELVDERALAITLLRATGLISRNDNPYREDPAGPQIEIPDGQMRGRWSIAFAVMPHAGSWDEGGVAEAAERYRHDLLAVPGSAATDVPLPAGAAGIGISGGVLSALLRVDEELELRVLRQSPSDGEVVIRGPFATAREVDLLGRDRGGLDTEPGELRLAMGAWEFRTVRLR
ncbi:MAG TPA: alpha-mannosidase [Candidatus Limnocylindria bacterium]|nr:alpha-mannosidase [Candidatus Limnocylindria bacterium]